MASGLTRRPGKTARTRCASPACTTRSNPRRRTTTRTP